MSLVDTNLIFLSGLDLESNSIIIKSTDGGDNWEIIPITLPVQKLDEIQFFNEEVGYATTIGFPGYNYGILKTEDGGANWMELNNGYTPFQFIDENTGFFYGYGLYKTIDGGYNFEHFGGGEGWELTNIYVINENNIWGILIGALDGDPTTRGIVKVHILEDGTYTEDIWYDGDSGIDMARIHFADEHTGYIVGYKYGNPTIWKNGTGTNTMSTNEPTVTQEIKIYPNPASEVLNIDFGKTISNINIVLSDITGKQLFSEKYKDKSKISVNTNNLSKGVYILSVYTGSQKFTKKIIIR